MIFKNIIKIIRNNYSSLIHEIAVPEYFKTFLVVIIFLIIPFFFGLILGVLSPIGDGIIMSIASVVSVLTGFSLNAIILMLRHDPTESYELETKIVDQTKDFTLYTIIIGMLTLVILIFGHIAVKSEIYLGFDGVIIYSIIIYSLLVHYFLGLFVILHRLFSLVRGGAIHS